MKIIDAHIHYSAVETFRKTAMDISKVNYSYVGYEEVFSANNVIMSIGMGLTEQTKGAFPDYESPNPMLLDLGEALPKGLHMCIGINPMGLLGETKELELIRIEEQLKKDIVIGIKVYAGYYPFYVYDEIYHPIYELAAKYQLPVVIHSGDTYSDRGLLKYSQPLHVDELAVRFRDVTFIIAHMGDPWVMDCAEVIAKNPNVYADLSGLIVGDQSDVQRLSNERLFVDHIKRALVYTDNYKKLLFGSDWPLVDLNAYIDFVKKLVPKVYYQDVFYNNALEVFHLT